VFVKKGTRVQYSVYQLHRRKDIYGEDAEQFRPERWGEQKVGRGWDYLPFNGGPRICLGRKYSAVLFSSHPKNFGIDSGGCRAICAHRSWVYGYEDFAAVRKHIPG
jgi:hypothetical protein